MTTVEVRLHLLEERMAALEQSGRDIPRESLDDVDELKITINILWAALKHYGDHKWACNLNRDHPEVKAEGCSCGFAIVTAKGSP